MPTLDPEEEAQLLLQYIDKAPLAGTDNVCYHLSERIGEGAQGWVYKALWDDPGGATVIVKILRPDFQGEESVLRFIREADVLRMLLQKARPNPYIVRFYDHAIARVAVPELDRTFSLPFTVLEYVKGTTLLGLLQELRGYGMAPERVRRLGRHITHALETLHMHKIVHRDLKPSNILIEYMNNQEIAKITDFGLVKLTTPGLNRTAALAGASLGYAPPEQFEKGNQRVSPATDVFSFGVIIFEMLTAQRAFALPPEASALAVLYAILSGPRPDLNSAAKRLSPEFSQHPDVVAQLTGELQRAMSPDPQQRHQSATEFWARVEPLLRRATTA